MATPKKAAPAKAKATTPAKKAATPQKQAPAKKPAAPAAKAAPPAKKAAPAPSKKAAPVKKAAPASSKPAAATKKAAVPSKAAVATTPKKSEPSPKKPAAPAKKVAEPVKKAPVTVKPEVKPAPKKAAEPVSKPAATKTATAKPSTPAAKPPAPAVKKPAARKPVMIKKPEPPKNDIPMRSATPLPPQKKKPVVEEKKDVKMPPITAKGKIPYDPDFTVSVLDSAKKDAVISTPVMRYSDSELAEFKELILRRLEAARKELSYLQGLITRKDEMGGDNDDGRYMTMEDGSLSMEREHVSQMASRQIQFIDHLEKALMRIESKTYGICRVTGKLIDKARLRAVPHATLSMEAKMQKGSGK